MICDLDNVTEYLVSQMATDMRHMSWPVCVKWVQSRRFVDIGGIDDLKPRMGKGTQFLFHMWYLLCDSCYKLGGKSDRL
jgi:hypothetical protein